jgi:hypothetical protein
VRRPHKTHILEGNGHDRVTSAFLDTFQTVPLSCCFRACRNSSSIGVCSSLYPTTEADAEESARRRCPDKDHVDAALREIRLALLEADVNYKVAKDFIASVKEKAEGQQVWLELKPSEQVVKIVLMSWLSCWRQSSRLVFTKTAPNVVMIVGCRAQARPLRRERLRGGSRRTSSETAAAFHGRLPAARANS